jgi:preprotein translocase subunit SecY
MWLGEQINERGIGNGISLVIFAGIVTSIPSALARVWDMVRTDQLAPISVILLFAFMVGVVGVIVYFERAQRRIPIQYARRVVGKRQLAGGMTYFPLRLNTSGVIPPIFASSLLVLPLQIAQWSGSEGLADLTNDWLGWSTWGYNLVYVALIVFFAYFYTGVMLNPDDVADNVRKNGGYIPGIRPGKRTAEYIDTILARITLVGALYLAAVAILPEFLITGFRVAPIPFIGDRLDAALPQWFTQGLGVTFYFGGTTLLIVVGVAMDTVQQVESQLIMRHYDGFMKKTRIRGRRG